MRRAAGLQLDLPSEGGSLWETQRSRLAPNRKEAAACSKQLLRADVWPRHKSPAQHHLLVSISSFISLLIGEFVCFVLLFWCNVVCVHSAERTKEEWGWLRISGSTGRTEMWMLGQSLTTTSSAPMVQRCGPTRPWRWRSSRGRLWQRSGSSSTGKHTEQVCSSSFWTLNPKPNRPVTIFPQGGERSRPRLRHHHPCAWMFWERGAVSPAGADLLSRTAGPQHGGHPQNQLLPQKQQEPVHRRQWLSDDGEKAQEVYQ